MYFPTKSANLRKRNHTLKTLAKLAKASFCEPNGLNKLHWGRKTTGKMQRWPTGAWAAEKRSQESGATGPRSGDWGGGGTGRETRRGRGPGAGGDPGCGEERAPRASSAAGGRRRPAPHLVEFILSCNPQLRVDGALQRLDDPVEVHLPGGGSAAPGPVGQTAALVFLLTLSASSSATPALPHSPTSATVATCSHLLRHSDSAPPVLPFYPPQLALHSPFYDSRWEAGEVRRGSGASFTAASSPGRDAMAAPTGGHHAPVRKVVSASSPEENVSPAPAGGRLAAIRKTASRLFPERETSWLGVSYSCFQIKHVWMERHFLLVREPFGHHYNGASSRADFLGPWDHLAHGRTDFPRSVGAIISSFIHTLIDWTFLNMYFWARVLRYLGTTL